MLYISTQAADKILCVEDMILQRGVSVRITLSTLLTVYAVTFDGQMKIRHNNTLDESSCLFRGPESEMLCEVKGVWVGLPAQAAAQDSDSDELMLEAS